MVQISAFQPSVVVGEDEESAASAASSPAAAALLSSLPSPAKPYDYLLKFLLVGDGDVGKQEILSTLEAAPSDMPFCAGPVHKVTTLLVDGRRVRLQLWDTSGQGRFCTILRSYSRGAQGILLVYDLTNKWSFDGIDRWRREVEEHAPGVPKVLVGNRLHLEFKRAVSIAQAEVPNQFDIERNLFLNYLFIFLGVRAEARDGVFRNVALVQLQRGGILGRVDSKGSEAQRDGTPLAHQSR